jgi:hypothetical protein
MQNTAKLYSLESLGANAFGSFLEKNKKHGTAMSSSINSILF